MSSTTIQAGYGPLDQADDVGIEEALIMGQVADQEFRTAAAEVFRGIARRPGALDLSAQDFGWSMSIEFS